MRTRKIIMVSGKAQAGKDTFCDFYKKAALNNNVKTERIAFADELKNIALQYGWNGSKEGEGRSFLIDVGQILRGDYELKHVANDVDVTTHVYSKLTGELTERSSYSLLELYYTLWAEYDFDPAFWVKEAFEKIKRSKDKIVIITDWRFKNEYESLKKLVKWCWPKVSIITVRVDNFRSLHLSDPSEVDLDGFHFNIHIGNHSSLDKLETCVKDIFNKTL